jgi:hypothetical protein
MRAHDGGGLVAVADDSQSTHALEQFSVAAQHLVTVLAW